MAKPKPLPDSKAEREEYLAKQDETKRGRKARASRRKTERSVIRRGGSS